MCILFSAHHQFILLDRFCEYILGFGLFILMACITILLPPFKCLAHRGSCSFCHSVTYLVSATACLVANLNVCSYCNFNTFHNLFTYVDFVKRYVY